MTDEPSPVKALVAAFLHENEEVYFITMATNIMQCLILQAVSIATALPPSPSNTLLRGKLLTKAGRYQEAIQELGSPENHVTKTDQSECRIVLGVAHLYAGEEGEVVRVLGEWAGQVPGIFQEMVYYMRGVANLRLKRNKSGLADINRSLVTNPRSYKVCLFYSHTNGMPFSSHCRLT